MFRRQIEPSSQSAARTNPSHSGRSHNNPTQSPAWTNALGSQPVPALQPKLTVNQPGDEYEQEADRVAAQVMRMVTPAVTQVQRCACGGIAGPDDECEACKAKRLGLQRKANGIAQTEDPPSVHQTLHSSGQPLDASTRAFMEPRFGQDFSNVRVHTDSQAAQSAADVSARAYTVGNNVVFGEGEYAPNSASGQSLIAHELTHTIQQDSLYTGQSHIQRTIGDGHDLTSPRFKGFVDLEAVFDDETVIQIGSSKSRGVQAVQQALYDLGFRLPTEGADGDFGGETKAALKVFQRTHVPPLVETGKVDKETMKALDARFAMPVLPAAAARSATWNAACVRSILCPWSPHTIDVLRTRITLKSFDSISWDDEKWDGAAWVVARFPGGGYNTGTEIGVLNSSCEEMSETLYHEVLHAEQPRHHSTTRQQESYAYRIGEEFSIALGLAGRPSLRSTDAQGRKFADPAKVGAFVASEYPGVPTGAPSDQIIGKAAAAGHVRIQRPDSSIYTRPAVIGEKVPGPMTTVNQVIHPRAAWTCP